MVARILIICVIWPLFVCGCEPPQQKPLNIAQCVARIEAYGPATLEIVGLSELKTVAGNEDTAKLKIFVKTLDSCGSAIKAPCVFRVEMYEYAARSQSPLGKRVEIWPDIDLTDPSKNNEKWRDYLRAYEFNLESSSKLELGRVYVIETTCLSPIGKRLSAQYKINYQK